MKAIATRLASLLLLVASVTTCGASSALAADPGAEPGAMLREGTWDDDVGSYSVPQALQNIPPAKWPKNGWYKLDLNKDSIHSEQVVVVNKQTPAFLQTIIKQIPDRNQSLTSPPPAEDKANSVYPNSIYLRVPGTQLQTGTIPAYIFKNGTTRLSPQLDYRYELKLGTQAFAFKVQNGLRGKNGAPYGEGPRYTIEYDGKQYEYDLPGYGWNSGISAIADLDRDGKPDFLIAIGDNNSGHEVILLSSKAKPGKNPVTASLSAEGC